MKLLWPRDPSLQWNTRGSLICGEGISIHSRLGLCVAPLPVAPRHAYRKPQGPKEHPKILVKLASQNLISVYISVSHSSFIDLHLGLFHLNEGTADPSLPPGGMDHSFQYVCPLDSSDQTWEYFHSLPHLEFAVYSSTRPPGPWKSCMIHLSFPSSVRTVPCVREVLHPHLLNEALLLCLLGKLPFTVDSPPPTTNWNSQVEHLYSTSIASF